MARKLLIALWRYVAQGVVPEGAVFKAVQVSSQPIDDILEA